MPEKYLPYVVFLNLKSVLRFGAQS